MLTTMPEPFPKRSNNVSYLNPEVNADLMEQMQKRVVDLQRSLDLEITIRRISETVRASLDEARILTTAVQELALELEADCYAVLHTNNEQKIFTSDCIADSPADIVALRHNPAIERQLRAGQDLQFCLRPHSPQNKLNLLVCPIFTQGENLISLWVVREMSNPLANSEIYLIQQIVRQCSIAMTQSHLYQVAQKQVETLKHLNQIKDDFVNQVTHDLRSPLSNMRLAIRMLEQQLETSRSYCGHISQQNTACSKTLSHVKVLQIECEREIMLVNDLLDLQRLETDKQILALTDQINLEDWLAPVIQPFENCLQQRQITLDLHITPHLPTLISNSVSLHRVLTELLHNACKYTPPHETISLRVSSYSNSVQIKVSNSGVEIPQEELPRIFDKFYRIPGIDRWKQGGTGLGLALVKETITHLGGSIQVESGNGKTCFIVQLLLR